MEEKEQYVSLFDLVEENEVIKEEEGKSKEVIQDLINTDWSKDNESQMRAVQLLKGISLSDEPG